MLSLSLALVACQPTEVAVDTSQASAVTGPLEGRERLPGPPGIDRPRGPSCGPEDDGDGTPTVDLQAALSPYMPTVIHVTWTGAAGDIGYDDGLTPRVAEGLATEHGFEAFLVGPGPHTVVTFWLEPDAGLVCSPAETLTTGELLIGGVPGLVETPSGVDPVDGLVFASWYGDPGTEHDLRSGMALLQRAGQPVWLAPSLEGYRIAAAEWLPEGVWTLQEPEVGTPGAAVVAFIGADGEIGDVIHAPDAHHDLVLFDDGLPGWLETDTRLVDDLGPVAGESTEVVGDRLVRLLADGSTTTLWSAWSTLDVSDDGLTWDTAYYGSAKDWSHANGLALNGDGDKVLISLLGLSSVVEVDVQSGGILWTLDGLALEDADTRIAALHSPVWSGTDRIMVFVNSGEGAPGLSYAAELDLALDPPAEVWNSGRDDSPYTSQALGRVAPLADRNVLVNYGQEGVLEELERGGDPLWRWSLDPEWVLGESGVVTLWEE